MNVFTLFLLTLTALFYLSPVQDAASENPVECNIDGGVQFVSNNAFFEHIGLPGDVLGLIEVCEGRIWKNIVLCEEEWTRENTVVACRQLGYAAAGSFVVDSNIVIEEQRRLSYRPQCTGMEERLVNCTQNYTQCEGEGGRRVAISCWNRSSDSSQPTLPVTTHTLAVQTGTFTSTPTVSSSTSDTGGQLVVVAVSGVVTVSALVLVVVVVVCTVWRNRRGHGRSDDEGESREMELNPAYQTTASLTSSITNPAYQTTASLISATTNPAYQTTASLISGTTNPAYQTTSSLISATTNPAYQTTASLISGTINPAYAGLPVNTTSPHLYEDVFHCQ